MKKKKVVIIASILLLLLILGRFLFGGTPVIAYKVEQQSAVKGVTVTGNVKSAQDANITSEITGIVVKTNVESGDYVDKGDIVAVLDSEEAAGDLISAEANLLEAKANLNNLYSEPRPQEVNIAKAQVAEAEERVTSLMKQQELLEVQITDAESEVERYKKLFDEGAISKREYEQKVLKRDELEKSIAQAKEEIQAANARLQQAQSSLSLTKNKVKNEEIAAAKARIEKAKGNLKAAEAKFQNHIIRAPMYGVITKRYVSAGDVATPQTPIYRIVSPENIYINVDVEENELKFIEVNQKAYTVFDAYPEKVYEGYVYKISRQVNPLTGTFEVRIIKPDNLNLVVGMTLDSTIIVNEFEQAIIVPSDFVSHENAQSFVYKKNSFWVEKIKVESVTFDNGKVRILNGLKDGDIIVKSKDNKPLKNGQRIKIEQSYQQ